MRTPESILRQGYSTEIDFSSTNWRYPPRPPLEIDLLDTNWQHLLPLKPMVKRLYADRSRAFPLLFGYFVTECHKEQKRYCVSMLGLNNRPLFDTTKLCHGVPWSSRRQKIKHKQGTINKLTKKRVPVLDRKKTNNCRAKSNFCFS